MKTLDLTCPRCTAVMSVDEKQKYAKCEYCGHQMVLEKQFSAEELRKQHEAESYGFFAGKYRAEEEAKERASRKEFKGRIIAVICLILVGGIGYFMMQNSKPLLEDPFVYLDVSFEGEDGKGRLSMGVRNEAEDGIDMARVNFQCESDTNLKAGDIIVIEATSDEYRLGTTSKRYTVEGLQMYLSDVSMLTEKQMEMILTDNIRIQVRNSELVLEDGEEPEITPLRIVCHSGERENSLYVISEIRYIASKKAFYCVSVWDDVIVRNSEVGNIDLGYGTYMGELTTVASPWCAMVYEDYEAALYDVEGELEANWKQTERELTTD